MCAGLSDCLYCGTSRIHSLRALSSSFYSPAYGRKPDARPVDPLPTFPLISLSSTSALRRERWGRGRNERIDAVLVHFWWTRDLHYDRPTHSGETGSAIGAFATPSDIARRRRDVGGFNMAPSARRVARCCFCYLLRRAGFWRLRFAGWSSGAGWIDRVSLFRCIEEDALTPQLLQYVFNLRAATAKKRYKKSGEGQWKKKEGKADDLVDLSVN